MISKEYTQKSEISNVNVNILNVKSVKLSFLTTDVLDATELKNC